MSAGRIAPCLWLDDQAEQAAAFYVDTFGDARVIASSRYPTSGDNPAGKPPGSVLTVELEIAGQRFTALNGGPQFTINPSISFFVIVDTPAEADRLFGALSRDGSVMMPLDAYPWSERYGWTSDRFGVSWQVMAGPRPESGATILPCLMFTGPASGRAQEAMRVYTGIFPDGRIGRVERYGPGEDAEGWVKHGAFVVGGQDMVAMDSPIDHGFTFDEGLSLQVMCADQREIDRYWSLLGEGGEPGPCGWVKDRFGLWWQVVPDHITRWLTSDDVEARERAFAAMMTMTKPDLAALEAAFEGR